MTKQSFRKCIACRVSEPKGELLRFVCTEKQLEFDRSSCSHGSASEKAVRTLNGRGAYLHNREDCFNKASNIKLWKYALREKEIFGIQVALDSVVLEKSEIIE